MNRLVLIDGNAVLHRAYHALPPLTAPDGSVVNAVYGFTTMLLRLINDLSPTHIAVAFDRPKPTFRKELFEGYQAKRPKMDDELSDQIPKVHRLVEAFGIPIFEMDGFEADDVIGTLAKQQTAGKDALDQVIIVTGDRDILQLVQDEKVLVYMPTKGLSEAKLYGEKEVKERMGVSPVQLTDYKALAGDPSDNYPGVPGVGPKTAAALVLQFGTVEGLFAAIEKKDKKVDTLGAGLLQKLKDGEESALLGKDLATIRTNVPLTGSIHRLESLNRPEAVKELTHLGFRTLLKRVTGEEISKTPSSAKATEGKEKKTGEQQQLL